MVGNPMLLALSLVGGIWVYVSGIVRGVEYGLGKIIFDITDTEQMVHLHLLIPKLVEYWPLLFTHCVQAWRRSKQKCLVFFYECSK